MVGDGAAAARRGSDRQQIVILGTTAKGGVAAVLRAYERAGLFARWPIVHVPTHCDGGAFDKLIAAARGLGRFLALLVRGRVLLVHVHSASNASFWRKSVFMLAAFAARRPVIFHLHGGGFADFYWGRCGPVRRAAVRTILARASQIVVLSGEWLRRIKQITANANLVAIPNPVEADDLLAIARHDRAARVILFMGRLDRNKGLTPLIEAFATLRTHHPDLQLCVAGEGPEGAAMLRHARELGVDDVVEFTGWISGAAKADVWARADLYVLPSFIEALPLTVLEAMAAGLPIVATRVGGVPDLVEDGVNGLIVEPRDATALGRALERILLDRALQRALGEQARRTFRTSFSPSHIISQVEALYLALGAKPLAGFDAKFSEHLQRTG